MKHLLGVLGKVGAEADGSFREVRAGGVGERDAAAAPFRRDEARDALQERRLAAPARSEHAHEFAGRDRKGHVAEDGRVSEGNAKFVHRER